MPVAPQLTCKNCGDPITEYKDIEQRIGRCCVGLARQYRQDHNGLYTVPVGDAPIGRSYSGDEDSDDYDDITDDRPRCFCGGNEFEVRQTRSVEYRVRADGGNDDYDDNTLWYDDGAMQQYDEDVVSTTVICRSCDSEYSGYIEAC